MNTLVNLLPKTPEITCGELTEPTNGYISYTFDTTAPFDFQTNASYACNTGYGLFGGNTIRTCVESTAGPGEWTGYAPTCEGIIRMLFHNVRT